MKKKRDDFYPVYRKLKDRIDQETEGVECANCEAEVTYNGLNYWISYTVTREFDAVFIDYDSEPCPMNRTFVSIHDYMVTDFSGNTVTTSFNVSEIEQMFDTNEKNDR